MVPPQTWSDRSQSGSLCCRLRSRSRVPFGARQSSLLLPPGTGHHIWPGALHRRPVVEALWLAFPSHIWLWKISAPLDPGHGTSRVNKDRCLGNRFRARRKSPNMERPDCLRAGEANLPRPASRSSQALTNAAPTRTSIFWFLPDDSRIYPTLVW